MRADQHIGQRPQGAGLRQRLDRGDIQRRKANVAGAQCVYQRRFVHDLAARDIDEDAVLLHGGKSRCVDHAFGLRGMRHRDDGGVCLRQGRVQTIARLDFVKQSVMAAPFARRAANGCYMQLKGAGALRNAARQIARANDNDAAASDLFAAITGPATLLLFGLQMRKSAPMGEQGHEHKLGQRTRMHAARSGDDDIGPVETKRLNRLPYAGAGGLDPFQPFRNSNIRRRAWQVPKDVGAGKPVDPAALLFGRARERLAYVISDIANRWQEVGLINHLKLVRCDLANALYVCRCQRRCNEDSKFRHWIQTIPSHPLAPG